PAEGIARINEIKGRDFNKPLSSSPSLSPPPALSPSPHPTLLLPAVSSSLAPAVSALRAHQVIAVPTDTIYGFAADARSAEGVARIYEIKGRDFNKPLAIAVADIADVAVYAETEHLPPGLLPALLPGPSFLVYPHSPHSPIPPIPPIPLIPRIPPIPRSTHSPIPPPIHQTPSSPPLTPPPSPPSPFPSQVLPPRYTPRSPAQSPPSRRIPASPFIRALARLLFAPLALTSANLSGHPSAIAAGEFRALWGMCAAVVDRGEQAEEMRQGSTIVELVLLGQFKVIRGGRAPQGEQQAGGQPRVPGAPQGEQQAGGQPRVPGAPQGEQQAGGQPRVPGAPHGAQQAGGQSRVPGAPQGEQQAGGQPRVPGAPQGEQQAGGQPRPRVPGAPQGAQQAGGQPGVTGAPHGAQQPGGQPGVTEAPQGEQQLGGQPGVTGAPQGAQQAGGQSMDGREQQLEEWIRLLEFDTPMATAEESEADREPPKPHSPCPRFPYDTCFHTFAMRGAAANHMRVCRAADVERRAQALGSIPSLVETDTQERPTPREFVMGMGNIFQCGGGWREDSAPDPTAGPIGGLRRTLLHLKAFEEPTGR
ncbi:unnamed protein product, partial [Closterium sp. Naga37s-1]